MLKKKIKDIEITQEQARQFAFDCFDILINDIKESEAKNNEEKNNE